MEKENEYEGMRELLQRGTAHTAPAGLDQKIMKGVMAFEHTRSRQRQALVSWLRFVAVGLVVILVARILGSQMSWSLSGKVTAGNIAGLAEKTGDAGRWLADHIYFLLPLVLLLFRRKWGSQNG